MFFGDKKIVALDIGTSSIKLAEVDVSPRGSTLRKFAVYPLNSGVVEGGEITDPPALAESISTLMKISKSKRKNVATGMFGNSVIVKKIGMPRMDEKLVAEQIRWEAEQYIPFDINEVSLEHHILRKSSSSESMEVLLTAAKQEFLFRYMEAIEMAGLKCSVMDVSGFALANCFEANYDRPSGAVALLDVGAGVTNFVVIDDGEVIFCRDIFAGGGTFTSEIQKAMSVSSTEAEALKLSASLAQEAPAEVNDVIASTTEAVVDEIRNGFDFFSSTPGAPQIKKLYVSGGSIFIPGLIEQISRVIGVPYEPLDPFNKIGYDRKLFTIDYIAQIKAIAPIAIGLGLRKGAGG